MDDDLLDSLTEIEEIECVLNLYSEAKEYLESFEWCLNSNKVWFENKYSFYDKIGVFLFEIDPIDNTVDDFVWVIVGDLPSVYLDKSVESGREAIEIYCELMEDWVQNVKEGNSTIDCYPIPNEPTLENAELLESRIEFIKTNLLLS